MGTIYRRRVTGTGGIALAMSIFLLVGLIFGGIGFGIKYADNKKKETCTEQTTGTVIDYATSPSSDNTTYAPIVSYDVDGYTYTVHNNTYSNPCPYKIGESVTIYYNPNNPHTFYIEGEKTALILAYVFMGIGGVFAAISVISIISVITEGIKSKKQTVSGDFDYNQNYYQQNYMQNQPFNPQNNINNQNFGNYPNWQNGNNYNNQNDNYYNGQNNNNYYDGQNQNNNYYNDENNNNQY